MNQNQLLELIRLLAPQIQDFLGGGATVSFKNKIRDISGIEIPQNGGAIGQGNSILLCAENQGGDVVVVQFTRSSLPFSPTELHFINQLCKGLTVLARGFDDPKHAVHHRTAILTTAFDIAVARFLRGDTRHFANVQRVIEIAKNLTFQRYEGAPCTSGLIYINKPTKGFLNYIGELGYRIAKTPMVRATSNFFGAPLSYRYVDGVQSAYLLVSPATCMGIVQLDPACHISLADQGTHGQYRPLLGITGAGSFAAFVTPNSEVDVLFAPDGILRWRKGRWILIELGRLASIFNEHINNLDTAKLLCEIVVGIAAIRHGALILLSDHTSEEIGIIRRIDDTEIGKMLRKSLLTLHILEAYRSGVFVAAVTSDGMTIIDSTGVVRDSGALVDLAGAKAPGGGGRTAAAQSASRHGLVIKISEDGPMQLWRYGELLMQTG
jgi:hypothetical protein